MHVASIYVYPVKSCRGFAVQEAELDALGIVGDRRFLVVDPAGKFMTQRTDARMAQIETRLTSDRLRLSHPEQGTIEIALFDPGAPLRTVQVWSSVGLQAEDCGSVVADWLSRVLEKPAGLVRIGEAFHRPIKPSKARPGDVVAFADSYPFLLVSEASLEDLNTRIAAKGESAVPMDRFRPNVVIAGAAAYAEDTWPVVRVGSVSLRAAGDCIRCVVTTTDQFTGQRGKEPLRTLATFRRDPSEPGAVRFGQNFIHQEKTGRIHVGDSVTPVGSVEPGTAT